MRLTFICYDDNMTVDFQTAGQISDDEISSIIVENLPEGVRLTCVMDSCHSGTGGTLRVLDCT